MITRLEVQNFKALRQVQVPLSPFTVLIGPNDSGKTSFLEAIYAIAESTRSNLANCFWSPWQHRELIHQNLADATVRFTAELTRPGHGGEHPAGDQSGLTYSLALRFASGHSVTVFEENAGDAGQDTTALDRNRHGHTSICAIRNGEELPVRNIDVLRRIADSFSPPALARWDVEELAMPSRLPVDRRYPFDPSGYGLATCIAEMKLGREGRFDALRNEFCSQFPVFEDIVIERANVQSIERDPQFKKTHGSNGEGYSLILLRKDGARIPASLASGGTLVTLAFLALTHLPEPRGLLLIEEPENALHPGRLKEVIALLRNTVKDRNDRQIILTTHSPLLLDSVEPEEVRVFLRNDRDDVEVYNLADIPDIRERLKYLMLGELVFNEGERELVKEIQEHAGAHSGRGGD